MTTHYARPLVRLVLVLTLATGAAACSTMSDLDPTGLLGSDEAPAEPFPTDSQQQASADADTTTPDLAAIPTRPPAPDTAAQADAAQSVAAAGAQAQYSADALRAGTDVAAPPPLASDAAATRQALAAADVPPTAGSDQLASSQAAADAPPSASAAPTTEAPAAAPPPVATVAAPVAAPAPAPAPAPVRSAALPPPPGAEPAVPAVPMTPGARMAMVNPSDAQLGFKPSSAPPLNSSINQWVSPPILAHYRQTAALAGTPGTAAPAVAAVSGGGGQAMSGNVIANLDAVPGTPAGMAAAMNGGIAPTAIVYFAGDGTSLSPAARTQVRNAVSAFQANGGSGTVKVIGHASSRTANMPVERHLEVIFQKSQARANAVAQALIRAGIPANKVIVQAVGDSQPIYYESMPRGEDGNRRAEIFVQG